MKHAFIPEALRRDLLLTRESERLRAEAIMGSGVDVEQIAAQLANASDDETNVRDEKSLWFRSALLLFRPNVGTAETRVPEGSEPA